MVGDRLLNGSVGYAQVFQAVCVVEFDPDTDIPVNIFPGETQHRC